MVDDTDRATALAQMRQRVTDESIKDTRRAFIWLDNEGERECYVTAERISELEAQLSIAGDALLKLQQYRDALIAERDAATARAEAATAESAAMREALELCPAPVPQTVPDRKLGIAEHQRISQLRAAALAPNAGANLLAELASACVQAARDEPVIAAAEALIRTQVSINEQPQIDSRAFDALVAAVRARNGAAVDEDARADKLLERLIFVDDPVISEALAMARGEELDDKEIAGSGAAEGEDATANQ